MVQRKKGETAGRQRAVIFDFDGTIADTLPAVAKVFEDLTRRPQPLSPDEIQKLRGMTGREFMATFKIPVWKAVYFMFRGRRMLRAHMDVVKLHVGVAAIIKELHAMGIPLYIVSSNSTEIIRSYLEQQGLSKYFIAVSGGASPFAKARKLLGLIEANKISVPDTWCVGDETRDIIAAHAVGTKAVAVSWGYNTHAVLEARKPDALVDTADELLAVLKDAWKK